MGAERSGITRSVEERTTNGSTRVTTSGAARGRNTPGGGGLTFMIHPRGSGGDDELRKGHPKRKHRKRGRNHPGNSKGHPTTKRDHSGNRKGPTHARGPTTGDREPIHTTRSEPTHPTRGKTHSREPRKSEAREAKHPDNRKERMHSSEPKRGPFKSEHSGNRGENRGEKPHRSESKHKRHSSEKKHSKFRKHSGHSKERGHSKESKHKRKRHSSEEGSGHEGSEDSTAPVMRRRGAREGGTGSGRESGGGGRCESRTFRKGKEGNGGRGPTIRIGGPRIGRRGRRRRVGRVIVPRILAVGRLTSGVGVIPSIVIGGLFVRNGVMAMGRRISCRATRRVTVRFSILYRGRRIMSMVRRLLGRSRRSRDLVMGHPPIMYIVNRISRNGASLLSTVHGDGMASHRTNNVARRVNTSIIRVGKRGVAFLSAPKRRTFATVHVHKTGSASVTVLMITTSSNIVPRAVRTVGRTGTTKVRVVITVGGVSGPDTGIRHMGRRLARCRLVPRS